MFDGISFDIELNELILRGKTKEAESRLLKAYSEAKASRAATELEHILCRLAHFYSMPEAEDIPKAESYFLEREAVSPGAYSKHQTALFYFYVMQDDSRTILKVEEISPLYASADRSSYYSALTLKGQALLRLQRPEDAKNVLEELISYIRANPSNLPYGDEVNLLEAASLVPILARTCNDMLILIIPKIRSQEHLKRAKALLNPA